MNADLFLLTDQPLHTANGVAVTSRLTDGTTLDSAPGFKVAGAEPMNASLHHDLSIDRNMSWVPAHGYVTYLTLNAPGATVTYDLGVGTDNAIRLTSFGSHIGGKHASPVRSPWRPTRSICSSQRCSSPAR